MSALVFSVVTMAVGEISTKVYLADGNTPLELEDPNTPFVYRDIMVGTKLSIIVYSDVNENWYGGGSLLIEGEEMQARGELHGRDCGEGGGCPGSCLPDAGEWAEVWEAASSEGKGVHLGVVDEPNAGDWFIIDYEANDLGYCDVMFYDYNESDVEPVEILSFNHVRTRDFNGDTKVDFVDFAVLASYWQAAYCDEPDWCEGADLDTNTYVDFNDMALFCKFWLEKTE